MDFNSFSLRMRREISELTRNRDESAAFLIWFLENYFRLELQQAIDCVCDHTNDKGIDGIYVDDEDEIIYLFQSKFSPNDNQDQGDNDIRKFIGSREWFRYESSIRNLLTSTANRELKSLVEREEIINKTNYKIVSVFITNKIFDSRAREYVKITEGLEAYDDTDLFQKYTFFADQEIIFPLTDLFLDNNTKIEYNLPNGIVVRVFSIKARELVKLQGIQDRTLFYNFN